MNILRAAVDHRTEESDVAINKSVRNTSPGASARNCDEPLGWWSTRHLKEPCGQLTIRLIAYQAPMFSPSRLSYARAA